MISTNSYFATSFVTSGTMSSKESIPVNSDLQQRRDDPVRDPIDLRSTEEKIRTWASTLCFKAKQAGKHYKKHKDEGLLRTMDIDSVDKYVSVAQKNIINCLFEKGFMLRTSDGDKIAFFTTDKDNYPKNLTVVHSSDNKAVLSTFFTANGKTPSLTLRNFKVMEAYVMHFENGISQRGWQAIKYDWSFGMEIITNGTPNKKLDKPINFFD